MTKKELPRALPENAARVIEPLPLQADILIEDDRWRDPDALVKKCFDIVTTSGIKGVQAGMIAMLFTDDAAVQQLNNSFRMIDKPTNVLSFPVDPNVPTLPGDQPPFLGDIALGYETCFREADEKAIQLDDHVAHLILHGVLHLFGYDHETNEDAEIMERLESTLLAYLGIADPHILMEK